MTRYFALVPAAGFGARMGGCLPKQYLPLLDHPLLYHSARRLLDCSFIDRVFIVLAPTDDLYHRHDWRAFRDRLTPLFVGGPSRSQSVLNGLNAVHQELQADDWMLVHDAARPCISCVLLERLKSELAADDIGGLLALPVADTLKRGDESGRVAHTESRGNLWQAQTPQMFRYRLLMDALGATAGDTGITDEASAVERMGLRPKLVMGDSRNLKVTYPQDLALAELILSAPVAS